MATINQMITDIVNGLAKVVTNYLHTAAVAFVIGIVNAFAFSLVAL